MDTYFSLAHRALACGCAASVRCARKELWPEICIVAAFAAHQWTCSVAGVKFIMPSSGSATESESADFFTNPSETVRLRDFENRNNTTGNRAFSVTAAHIGNGLSQHGRSSPSLLSWTAFIFCSASKVKLSSSATLMFFFYCFTLISCCHWLHVACTILPAFNLKSLLQSFIHWCLDYCNALLTEVADARLKRL